MSAAAAGSVRPSAETRLAVHTPLKLSSVAVSSTGAGASAAPSGFSRLISMAALPSENWSMPSCRVSVFAPSVSTPSRTAHWKRSTSPFMFISAAPSALMVRVSSMLMSASG